MQITVEEMKKMSALIMDYFFDGRRQESQTCEGSIGRRTEIQQFKSTEVKKKTIKQQMEHVTKIEENTTSTIIKFEFKGTRRMTIDGLDQDLSKMKSTWQYLATIL